MKAPLKLITRQRTTAMAWLLAAVLFSCFASNAFAQISIPAFASPVTQDFNTLTNTPDNGTSSTLPAGWVLSESSTNANTTYRVSNGALNTGDTYSYGATGAADRAFGGLQSGSLIPVIGASFTNNTGGTIGSLTIAYTGEQWRIGTLGRLDRMDFQYSLDATSLTTGNWTDVDALDFTAPVQTGTVGALDGNAAPNRTAVSSTITGLSIGNGATFWIRWNDLNATSSDDGLGVDDFSLQAAALVPAASPLAVGLLSLMLGVAAVFGLRRRAMA